MPRYIATLNPTGVDKLRAIGASVTGRTLAFIEDTEKHAHTFYRRYTRNFFGIVLNDSDYSIYEPAQAELNDTIPLGMRSNPYDMRPAKPGRAG
ncbi:hypothetical protein KIKIMORA_04380 [Brevundimonas phage vB_BpoS-Kikimora]|uniref:Uncharacterized protein n=1 Tax=Brevundimonas phage vB_BpoS-Kikimora TaxID=2948601 RepID=A0A9E7MRK0_9CAUD|nr:hypothetical protein KIKIMORA_04380 [Brevundimonas phage vB_BpoS-Kikimora]